MCKLLKFDSARFGASNLFSQKLSKKNLWGFGLIGKGRVKYLPSYLTVIARVLHDRLAEEIDELTIEKGKIIENVIEKDDGWWEGVINGKRGLFPGSLVEPIEYVEAGKKDNTDCVKGGNYFLRVL